MSAPFRVGQKAVFDGAERTVTSVIRSDIAPSGYLVECDGPTDAQGISGAPNRTGLRDASNFTAIC